MLPTPIQEKATISLTFTTSTDGKKFQSLTIVATPESEPCLTKMKCECIELLGRTIFPIGYVPNNKRLSKFYPRKAKVKISNLPFFCGYAETMFLLCLPNQVEHSPLIPRETFSLSNDKQIYTGRAILDVIIKNEKDKDELRKWSYTNAMKDGLAWHAVCVSFHIPSLHSCEHCKAASNLSTGTIKMGVSTSPKKIRENRAMRKTRR